MTALSACYLNADGISGMADGSIVQWKGRNAARVVKKAHNGPIFALYSVEEGSGVKIISGGKDGVIKVILYLF